MKYETIDCHMCDKGLIIMGRNISDTGWCKDLCSSCNGTGKIKGDFIIINDPVEAVFFIGKKVQFVNPDNDVWDGSLYGVTEDGFDDGYGNNANKLKVHKSIVKEVCEPKTGMGRGSGYEV